MGSPPPSYHSIHSSTLFVLSPSFLTPTPDSTRACYAWHVHTAYMYIHIYVCVYACMFVCSHVIVYWKFFRQLKKKNNKNSTALKGRRILEWGVV